VKFVFFFLATFVSLFGFRTGKSGPGKKMYVKIEQEQSKDVGTKTTSRLLCYFEIKMEWSFLAKKRWNKALEQPVSNRWTPKPEWVLTTRFGASYCLVFFRILLLREPSEREGGRRSCFWKVCRPVPPVRSENRLEGPLVSAVWNFELNCLHSF
jgi:hypothetical protein